MPCQVTVYLAKRRLAINKGSLGQSRNEELRCNHLQPTLKEVQLAFYKEKINKETYCIHFKQIFI